jgi:hypothetical protein
MQPADRLRSISVVTTSDARSRVADEPVHPDYATAIYGSLLVTSLVAVQWRHEPSTDAIALTLVVSVVVFWLAHVWSEIVSRRVRGPIGGREARGIALAEVPMLEAAVLPVLILALGRIPAVPIDVVIPTALVVCIAQLFVWGLVVGRAAHSSRWLALRVAILDSLLGIAIVGLKVLVIH